MKNNRLISARSTMSFRALLSMFDESSLNNFVNSCQEDLKTCEKLYMEQNTLAKAFGGAIHIDAVSTTTDNVLYLPKISNIKVLVKYYITMREKMLSFPTFNVVLETHLHDRVPPESLLSMFDSVVTKCQH
ncbi:MAG: hypothetical protein ACRC92_26575 [Peptostreptococcaceae bacterium]